ncbi:cobalamin-binding protein [Undibacterium terreum]|uniref:Cobalamin-binding protein n=1 Tax=Undibacterium terreum TaxID=1224302 RepID=A0A916XHM3_9BURK|nr:cobalamin-binding protein [Undibacterium terreum]GGC72426.1 cobalamin-binding protein [Undibacterium terreum]
MKKIVLCCVFPAALLAVQAQAAITVTDDAGNTITLQKPAQRVISLSPHVTELIYAAGAGDRIVATVKYSDYPPAAKDIPRVGDNRQVDIERVIAMKPDLLIVWMHGAFERQLEPLKKSGIPYFFSDPRKLEQIPETLLKMGAMFGTEKQAQLAANDFRQQVAQLSSRYQSKSKVKVFYQVWGKPLYTLNDQHIVSDVIRTCGGENIFGRLPVAAPTVNLEAVLAENPEVVLSGDSKNQVVSGIEQWKPFPSLLAVKNHNLVAIDGDELNRPGPRIIDGAKAVCDALEVARTNRNQSTGSKQK